MKVLDHVVKTPKGSLFAKSWNPQDHAEKSPILLLHDSLGCVQLWRDFPEKLAQTTRRQVIAYDRLGFGKSDKNINKPEIDFIAREAEEFFPIIKNQIGFKEFALFGHSVGGAMAVLIAKKFSKECVAVITESAQAFVEDRTLEGIKAAQKIFQNF